MAARRTLAYGRPHRLEMGKLYRQARRGEIKLQVLRRILWRISSRYLADSGMKAPLRAYCTGLLVALDDIITAGRRWNVLLALEIPIDDIPADSYASCVLENLHVAANPVSQNSNRFVVRMIQDVGIYAAVGYDFPAALNDLNRPAHSRAV